MTAIERVRAHLDQWQMAGRVTELAVSSATVAEAAAALHTEEGRIAKSLSFLVNGRPLLVVCAGDARIDNKQFKAFFGQKPSMIKAADVESLIGYPVGGVCPFGVKPGVTVYLDESLRRYETVFPACGTANSMIELTLNELETCAAAAAWISVTKDWQGE
ncbi:YbaK/EbsC family protein [Megasphaera vaginalis (ex Srinivasan et al. 2021)]|uniref:Aminoacyl-tRNA editing domain protein n=1 Tax=Megasphaera vaginalis (ex Srinivasan et al. 2021) TaxID=1111454 RepID=U7UTV5_9FIRM|nr:YbaK/EbsC family protein [Megasphaera vaginalis (ex Srinivasan et al. 2021)]ERT62716.1 aminoacyl-tRNA editing domain protein [Megasphaera vaginalis (ex Srinivasan et al. 2021)]